MHGMDWEWAWNWNWIFSLLHRKAESGLKSGRFQCARICDFALAAVEEIFVTFLKKVVKKLFGFSDVGAKTRT